MIELPPNHGQNCCAKANFYYLNMGSRNLGYMDFQSGWFGLFAP